MYIHIIVIIIIIRGRYCRREEPEAREKPVDIGCGRGSKE